MTNKLVCWKCGMDLSCLPQPLGRRAACTSCHAELHVCRMCRHFDTGKAKQCREPMAEEVKDKVRANFCEWFQAKDDAFAPSEGVKSDARSALDALFGASEEGPEKQDVKSDLDRLFGD